MSNTISNWTEIESDDEALYVRDFGRGLVGTVHEGAFRGGWFWRVGRDENTLSGRESNMNDAFGAAGDAALRLVAILVEGSE